MSTRAVLIPLVLLLVLSACAAPIASPSNGTPAPVDTALPFVETATPLPTALPAAPTPTPTLTVAAESGAAGEEAVVAGAVEIAAKALGVDPNAVQFVSIEAVQWPELVPRRESHRSGLR